MRLPKDYDLVNKEAQTDPMRGTMSLNSGETGQKDLSKGHGELKLRKKRDGSDPMRVA